MAVERDGGSGGPSLTRPRPPANEPEPGQSTPSPYSNVPIPQVSLPNSVPIVPVAGVSVNDLVDSFGAARDGGARAHKGVDIFAASGTPVISTVSGRVIAAGESGGKAGLRVWVQGDDGRYHFFAHMSAVNVRTGMNVTAGQFLGRVGKTGNAQGTPAHLHYSVNSKPFEETGDVNPFVYLRTGKAAPAAAYSTMPWTPADLSLPSDDDGDWDDADMATEPSFRDILIDNLTALSAIVAGGQPVDPSTFTLPIPDQAENGEGQGGEVQAAAHQQGAAGGTTTAPSPSDFTPGNTGNPDRDFIINRENQDWNPAIYNGGGAEQSPTGSSAFGLGQIIESNRQAYGQKLGINPMTTDPTEQLALMDAYVEDRYGDYATARRFHEQNGWY